MLPMLAQVPATRPEDRANPAKLTAHFHDPRAVADFDCHAKASGLSRGVAAKLLFENELTERWLLRAIEQTP